MCSLRVFIEDFSVEVLGLLTLYRDALLEEDKKKEVMIFFCSMPLGGGSCQSEPMPSLITCSFNIFHGNARSLFSKLSEINSRIVLMVTKPSILCFTESWLNSFVGTIAIIGYVIVVGRDGNDGCIGGGKVVLVADPSSKALSLFWFSNFAKRVWCVLHLDIGPILE